MLKKEREEFITKFQWKNYYVTGGMKTGKTFMAMKEFDHCYRLTKISTYYFKDKDISSVNLYAPISRRMIFDVCSPESVLPLLPDLDKRKVSYSLYFTPTTTDFLKELRRYNFVAHYNLGGAINPKDTYEEFTPGTMLPTASSVVCSNVCPRCSSQMIKKTSTGLFGDSFDVMKCPNCQYCN